MDTMDTDAKILLSVLARDVISNSSVASVLSTLKANSTQITDLRGIARSFNKPKLTRQLHASNGKISETANSIVITGVFVTFGSDYIGRIQILYKSTLPGELQARLAVESAIDRFLEYLLKKYQIVVLSESDRHVQIFIPGQEIYDFKTLWETFLKEVAFSDYGDDNRLQMPGLVQTFIVMLNAVTLSGRGFSTLDIPILTRQQADVLAAWYLAVIQAVEKRQTVRGNQIKTLQSEIELIQTKFTTSDLTDKEQKTKAKELQSKEKDLAAKEEMQAKEAKKYSEAFDKSFAGNINDQIELWAELTQLDTQLSDDNLPKKEQRKLHKQRDKITSKIVFSEEWLIQKRSLLQEVGNQPFELVKRDCELHPEKFQNISGIAKRFDRKATDQINSTRGDIFTQCITEMYRLLELQEFASLPLPLLSEIPQALAARSAGDDSKTFCYACGINLDPKTARWQVLRFMFERPSQRRQSSSGEGRPHICASCSALSFASPLKVTDESIILRLSPADEAASSSIRLKDYIRMLTNKEVHLSAGKYVVLASDRTNKGDLAAPKLGQLQYALAKVASIFPQEVLADFRFYLILQSSEIPLPNRYLLFIKGLMDSYGQSIIVAGKEINMKLGEAIRYIQDDLPILANYTIAKISSFENQLGLEKVRSDYWEEIRRVMKSSTQIEKRATLYRDVAALTGVVYAFVSFIKNSKKMKELEADDQERELRKLIEEAEKGPNEFSYYAARYEDRENLSARLYQNPETHFIYAKARWLLHEMKIQDREEREQGKSTYLVLNIDDLPAVYDYFRSLDGKHIQEKDWRELTYQLKLSLYSRFPKLVRSKSDSKGE